MEFKTFYIEELLKIKNGKDHKALNDGNYPVYGSGGLMRYADKYLYDKVSILLPRKGTLDNIQYVNEPFWTVDTIYYTEVNERLVNPYYLFRYLRAMDLSGYDSGASIPSMTTKTYNRIKVKLPPLVIQNRITDVIRNYDELIEVNNQRIKKLEQTAEELYKEWFIRFRFPDYQNTEFENGIPKGWKVVKVSDFCKVFTGKKDVNQTIKNGAYKFFSCSPDVFYSNEYIYDGEAVIVAGNGSYTGRTRYYAGKFDLYQRTYAIICEHEDNFLKFLYWTFKVDFEKRFMGGTRGAAIPYIVMGDITKYRFLYSPSIASAFTNIVDGIYEELEILNAKNENLIKQRDLLLPRLMSGKLEVKL